MCHVPIQVGKQIIIRMKYSRGDARDVKYRHTSTCLILLHTYMYQRILRIHRYTRVGTCT